jgi:uncharacterized Zn-finger protein
MTGTPFLRPGKFCDRFPALLARQIDDQCVGNLWLVNRSPTDSEPAISNEVAHIAADDGQQRNRCQGRRSALILDHPPVVLDRRHATTPFGDEHAMGVDVGFGPQTQAQPSGFQLERHRRVRHGGTPSSEMT